LHVNFCLKTVPEGRKPRARSEYPCRGIDGRSAFQAARNHKAGNGASRTNRRKTNMTTSRKPVFEVFTVREGKKRKSYFTKIGAAWPTRSGNGLTLDLHALPLDGRLILMPPKVKEEGAVEEAAVETVDDDGPYIND